MGRRLTEQRTGRHGVAGRRRAARAQVHTPRGELRALAEAVGEAHAVSRRLNELANIGSLRIAVIASAYGLDARATPARLRKSLAEIASRCAGTVYGRPRSAAAERTCAAMLINGDRAIGSDHDLLAWLAAQIVGAPSASAAALRLHLLQRRGQARTLPPRQPAPATPAGPVPPVLADFAREVRQLASPISSGWAGNRRAFINHVWRSVAETHPGWGLDERAFKSLLAEAHRTGHIQLANADLRDKTRLTDVQASATVYKNMVWHFIRVEDE